MPSNIEAELGELRRQGDELMAALALNPGEELALRDRKPSSHYKYNVEQWVRRLQRWKDNPDAAREEIILRRLTEQNVKRPEFVAALQRYLRRNVRLVQQTGGLRKAALAVCSPDFEIMGLSSTDRIMNAVRRVANDVGDDPVDVVIGIVHEISSAAPPAPPKPGARPSPARVASAIRRSQS